MTQSSSLFEYDQASPVDVRYAGERKTSDYTIQNLTFLTPFGYRRAAYLVKPRRKGPFPAILYVHWLETWALNANRTQFLPEAQEMARRGVVSLLVETMWSDQDWFIKRTQSEDRENTVKQVIELRKAMDLLFRQGEVDPERFVLTGHDFGAMVGILAGDVDRRPKAYALMAPTSRFSDWYLYYPPVEKESERKAFTQSLAPFDPVAHIGSLGPAPILLQFGREDPHVPEERATELAEAAPKTAEIRWYAAGHELNEQAAEERKGWVADRLSLESA